MKYRNLLFFLLLAPYAIIAQINISAQLPPAGFVQKDQLWNLVLVNNKEDVLDVSIRMNLQDAATGQVLLSASSGNLMLGKGVKNISFRDVQPIIYNYLATDFTGSYLPMGGYIVCYQLVTSVPKETPVSEDCLRMNIEPLSPPLLNIPADRTELLNGFPQFSWIPPAPFEMFRFLNYDLLVTEVLPGQSPAEAINANNPVYYKTGLQQTTEMYPSSYQALDTGKLYAWNIVARNQNDYAVKSEIWTFSVKGKETLNEVKSGEYFLLRDDIVSTYNLSNDQLMIKYFSYTSGYDTEIIFSSSDTRNLKKQKIHIKNGDNYLQFSLGGRFKEGQLYTVSFKDSENKIHSLRFNIIK
jgi:hypothetical protein